MTNDELRAATGTVRDPRPLVGFLYDLMKLDVPVGRAENLVKDSEKISEADGCIFSNGHLARYAQLLADRLLGTVAIPGSLTPEALADGLKLATQVGVEGGPVDAVAVEAVLAVDWKREQEALLREQQAMLVSAQLTVPEADPDSKAAEKRTGGRYFTRWTCTFPGKMGLSWKRAWDGEGSKEEAEAEAAKNCNVVAVPVELFEKMKHYEHRTVEAERKLQELKATQPAEAKSLKPRKVQVFETHAADRTGLQPGYRAALIEPSGNPIWADDVIHESKAKALAILVARRPELFGIELVL